MKNGYVTITVSVDDRPSDDISGKAEYPWFETSARHFVGSAGFNFFMSCTNQPNIITGNHYRQQLMRFNRTLNKKNGRYTNRDKTK